jgi:hypothetical protein
MRCNLKLSLIIYMFLNKNRKFYKTLFKKKKEVANISGCYMIRIKSIDGFQWQST